MEYLPFSNAKKFQEPKTKTKKTRAAKKKKTDYAEEEDWDWAEAEEYAKSLLYESLKDGNEDEDDGEVKTEQEKQFFCDQCEYSTHTKQNLKNHRKRENFYLILQNTIVFIEEYFFQKNLRITLISTY